MSNESEFRLLISDDSSITYNKENIDENFIKKNYLKLEEFKLNISTEQMKNLSNFDHFKCGFCLHLLNSPVSCLNCENLFCYACLVSFQNENKNNKCICGEDFVNLTITKSYKNILNNLEIYCPLETPCGNKFKINNLSHHLNNCGNIYNDYTCKFCNIVFYKINNVDENKILANHLNICTRYVTPSETCKTLFNSNESFENSLNSKEFRSSLCQICDSKLDYKDIKTHTKDDCIVKFKNKIISLEDDKSDMLIKLKKLEDENKILEDKIKNIYQIKNLEKLYEIIKYAAFSYAKETYNKLNIAITHNNDYIFLDNGNLIKSRIEKGYNYKLDFIITFEGEFTDFKFTGKSKNIYDNGIYEGEYKNSLRDGYGIFSWSNIDNDKYAGYWINDKQNGNGKFYKNSKLIYDGEFKDEKYNGKGKYYFKKGIYEGDFDNGLRSGFGTYKWIDKEKYYIGEWISGKKTGSGKLYEGSVLIYDGFFKDDLYHGKGKEFLINGQYEGEFQNGHRNGFGKYKWITENEYYEGYWSNDKQNGTGKLFKNSELIYEGEFKDGEYHGIGKEYYNNGEFYDGEFVNGCRKDYINLNVKDNVPFENKNVYEGYSVENYKNGYGKLYENLKLIYEGEFKDYKYNGKGKEYLMNGEFEGEFENGFRSGYGKYTWLNENEYYEGFWFNDKQNGYGKLFKKSKIFYEGNFKNGVFQGHGKQYNEKEILEGEFDEGKLIVLIRKILINE